MPDKSKVEGAGTGEAGKQKGSAKGQRGKGKKIGRNKAKCAAYRQSGQKDKRNFLSALKSCGISFAEEMGKAKGVNAVFMYKAINKRKAQIGKE